MLIDTSSATADNMSDGSMPSEDSGGAFKIYWLDDGGFITTKQGWTVWKNTRARIRAEIRDPRTSDK